MKTYISYIVLILFFIISCFETNLIIQYLIEETNPYKELKQFLLKTTPTIFGAIISSGVAIIIFYLTKHKEQMQKINNSKSALEIIKEEIKNNRIAANDLNEILVTFDNKAIVEFLKKDPSLKEKLIIISSKFSLDVTDKLLTSLVNRDFLEVIEEINNIKKIISHLESFNNEIVEDENKIILLEIIQTKISNLLSIKDSIKSKNMRKEKYSYYELYKINNQRVLIIIVIYALTSFIINFFL